ncbi:MAG TPA: DUF2141 domain-containing protein [Thermoguttaceae bacterium]|nr:DUF2141 domain-containing protein [Thermoguttaceae bacterium]
MRWTKGITLCLLFLAATASGGLEQVQAGEQGDLRVVFTGLSDNAGRVRIALVNTEAGYKDEEKHGFRLAEAKVKELESQHTFSDVPLGTYSIKAYHDQNGDKRHNKSLFGQPLEPYGFSNNVRGRWGPPAYESTRFRFRADGAEISIGLAK